MSKSSQLSEAKIRPFTDSDWVALWSIIRPVFREGTTYAFDPDISEKDTYGVWIDAPAATFVVEDEKLGIIGTYYIEQNQPSLGDHVCNCGYIVSENARGKGLAARMCKHSQAEAIKRGFRAMQYNLVVSTNVGAIQIWKKHGFEIVGSLTGAFRHADLGYVDAYVMFKELKSSPSEPDKSSE